LQTKGAYKLKVKDKQKRETKADITYATEEEKRKICYGRKISSFFLLFV